MLNLNNKKLNRLHVALGILALTVIGVAYPLSAAQKLKEDHHKADEALAEVSALAAVAKQIQQRSATLTPALAEQIVKSNFGSTAQYSNTGESAKLHLTKITAHQLYQGLDSLRTNAGGAVTQAGLNVDQHKTISGFIDLKYPIPR